MHLVFVALLQEILRDLIHISKGHFNFAHGPGSVWLRFGSNGSKLLPVPAFIAIWSPMIGWPQFGSVRARDGSSSSRTVPVPFSVPGKTVPTVPVPLSVPGKPVPTVPVSGSGSVPRSS